MRRRVGSPSARAGLALAALLAGVACRDGARPAARADAATATSVWAVRVGAFPDSAAAMRLRDSLDRAGWEAYVRRAAADDAPQLPPWRVHLAPAARESDAPRLVAAVLARDGLRVSVVADTVTLPQWVLLHRVSTGGRGMLARARWVTDGSGRRLLAVQDEAGVEHEAMPDGFLYVAETARGAAEYRLQRDSVWDVAPSPDWSQVAYGRAYAFRNPDSLAMRDAGGISWFTGVPIPEVQRHRFPVSAMDERYGFAAPRVEPLADTGVVTSEVAADHRARVPVAGGWRVRWTTDGRSIAVGRMPASVRDDAPPREWVEVDVTSRLIRGPVRSQGTLARVAWITGPLLDVSAPLDSSAHSLAVEGGSVESAGGWIRLRGGASGWAEPRIVGPGRALAATRTGRFVLALAPVPDAKPTDTPTQLVVYEVRP